MLPIQLAMAAVVCAAAASAAAADTDKDAPKPAPDAVKGLKLTLSADKTEVRMLPEGGNVEPIRLTFTFANAGGEPFTLDMSPASWYYGTALEVVGPDADGVRFEAAKVEFQLRGDRAEDYHLLKAGDEWTKTTGFPVTGDRLQGHYCLLKPGEYRLYATYKPYHAANSPFAKGSWSEPVKSADLVLKVRAADDFGPEVKGLKAKVVVAKTKCAVGEAVEVTYVVKNVSPVEQTLWHSGFWPNHQILVHNADGKEPLLTTWGAQGRKAFSPGGDRDKNISVKLAAGAEDDSEGAYDLGKVYDLSKPGHYTVQYVYEEKQGGWEGRLPSNEAAFEISAKDDKP